MENAEPLKATMRGSDELGKGFARRLRVAGQIPAVCYGNGSETLHLAISPVDVVARLKGQFGLNAMFKLDIDGHEQAPLVRVNDFQKDPVRRNVTHVDFSVINPERALSVTVPLNLVGRPVGVAAGGKLRQIRRELKIVAQPANIPVGLEIDVSDMKINDFWRVADVPTPEGVELVYDQNFAVATVFLPRGTEEAGEEEEAVAE